MHHPPLSQVQILQETEQTVGLNRTFMTKYPSVVMFTPASVQVNRNLERFTCRCKLRSCGRQNERQGTNTEAFFSLRSHRSHMSPVVPPPYCGGGS